MNGLKIHKIYDILTNIETHSWNIAEPEAALTAHSWNIAEPEAALTAHLQM